MLAHCLLILYFWPCQYCVLDGHQDKGAVNCLLCRTLRASHLCNTYFSLKIGKKLEYLLVLY